MLTLPHLFTTARTERMPLDAAASTTVEINRVGRLDGRTKVVSVRDAEGWRTVRRLRWTRTVVHHLRESGIREVVLRRGLRRGRLPLTWIPSDPGR